MSKTLFDLPNKFQNPALPQSLTVIRVLIADDDEFMLDRLEEVLNQLGLKQIHRARDGNELLVYVDQPEKCPDLIFCDLDMDGMDGIECLRNLADRSFRGAMIAVSGANPRLLGSMADLAHEHHIEFLGAIAKPIDSESIRSAIMAFGARLPPQGDAPTHVLLEITETPLMVNFSSSLEVIGRLRLKGFQLSIDDFGIGYANPEKLVHVPFDEIKIDRAFVHNAANDATARAVLESSVDLGHILGMQVVGEGAKTLDDSNLLAAIGCDIAQGYNLARPMAADQFIDWKIEWEAQPGKRE